MTNAAPDTILTVLFADIIDSSRLYSERGDAAAQDIIRAGVDLLKDVVEQYSGTVIKTIGDEVMASFEDPAQAIRAALFMIKILDATSLSDQDDRLKVKIGAHTGSVILKDDDVFGNTVNTAARVVAQAKPRQLLASKQTLDAAAATEELPITTRLVDHLNLKGIADVFDLYEIFDSDAEDVENMTYVMDGEEDSGEDLSRALVLSHGGRDVILDRDNPTVRLGRDASNHIIVVDKAVSRYHARIDFEKGKFTLTDQSVNGTFVIFPTGASTNVHRDKFPLDDKGGIGLGQAYAADSPHLVKFKAR